MGVGFCEVVVDLFFIVVGLYVERVVKNSCSYGVKCEWFDNGCYV